MPQNKPMIATRAEFAELFSVSSQAVSQWIQAGMPARQSGKRGRVVEIDLSAAVPWALRRLERHGPAHERLTAERADKLALENEQTRAGRVMAHQVEQAVSKTLADLDKCLVTPDDLAEQIAGTDDPAQIRSILMDWSRNVRTQYADRLAAIGTKSSAA